jgi:hypothetical protein
MAALDAGNIYNYHPEDEVADDEFDAVTRELEAYDDDDDWIPDHPGTY